MKNDIEVKDNNDQVSNEHFTMPEPDQVESGVPFEAVNPQVMPNNMNAESFNQRLNHAQHQAQHQTQSQANFLHQPQHQLNKSSGKANLALGTSTNTLSGMSIKNKLIYSLSAMTLIILVLGVISYSSIATINDFSRNITTEFAELTRITENIRTTTYQVRAAEKDFVILEEESALTRSSRLLQKLRGQLKDATALAGIITERTGENLNLAYGSILEETELYQQRFEEQVKDIKQARSAINKDLAGTEVAKSDLLKEINLINDDVRNLVDDYWIGAKRAARLTTAENSAIATSVITSEASNALSALALGELMVQLNRSILEAQVKVARYLQLNQQAFVLSTTTALDDALFVAENIRQTSNDDALTAKLKIIITSIKNYQLSFNALVSNVEDVLQNKSTIDLSITAQKKELQLTGDKVLSLVEGLSSDAWNNIKTQSRALQQTGSNAQFWLLTVALIGAVLGFLILWLVPRPIIQSISQLLSGAQSVAAGNLTAPLQVNSKDELGQLANTFEAMRLNLLSLVERIQRSSVQISTTVNEISAAANQQSSTANEQSASISQFMQTLSEISQTSSELAKTAKIMSDNAGTVANDVSDSNNGSQQTLESMTNISDATRKTSERIKSLNDQMDGITDAVESIANVADQTTLLSLNAAIEANKAGELGKGFSVVATEIRRLSERSTDSATGITQMVRDIQRSTESSVVSMDKSAEEIRTGINLVKKSTQVLQGLNEQIEVMRQQTFNISSSSEDQARGSSEANSTINQLLSSADVAAQAARQTSGAAQELSSMAAQLSDAVASFKTR